jgi:2,4-dienoyl-CoA reductase-like NADH-dependent reductase (Old Yellow Enzyme family)
MHGGERIEGGMTAADVRQTAGLLAAAGVDAFSVSACNQGEFVDGEDGGYWSLRPYLTKTQPAGWAASDAAAVREGSGKPVIAAGKLGDPEVAERLLAEGKADLIGIGRNFLADPEVVKKMLSGRGDEIRVCRQCFLCHTTTVGKLKPVRCAINPKVGSVID